MSGAGLDRSSRPDREPGRVTVERVGSAQHERLRLRAKVLPTPTNPYPYLGGGAVLSGEKDLSAELS